jgi:hypothetical protein
VCNVRAVRCGELYVCACMSAAGMSHVALGPWGYAGAPDECCVCCVACDECLRGLALRRMGVGFVGVDMFLYSSCTREYWAGLLNPSKAGIMVEFFGSAVMDMCDICGLDASNWLERLGVGFVVAGAWVDGAHEYLKCWYQ